jgi:hypothetical protein
VPVLPRPHPRPPSGSPRPPEEGPREHRGELLTGRIRLDHGRFIGCRFRKATLLYAGLGPSQLSGCTFEDTLFEFDGPAGNALAFLQAMSSPGSGLGDVVKASFPRLFGH